MSICDAVVELMLWHNVPLLSLVCHVMEKDHLAKPALFEVDPLKITERLQLCLTQPQPSKWDEERELLAQDMQARKLISAAVLIPIINRGDQATILFTQRASHLTDHGGQVSFPGGRVEPHDKSIEETALRETEEEIGLLRKYVKVLGKLSEYQTRTGFLVTPIVGWIEPGFTLQPDSIEVAEVFEVPLSFLLDTNNHQQKSILWEGQERRYYAMPYEHRNIWGVTAGILRCLYFALQDSEKS